MLPYTERQWRAFLDEIGRADIAREPWFDDPRERAAHIDALYALVAASLAERTAGAWITELLARDIPCSKLPGLDDMLDDPHLEEIGFFDVPADYPEGIGRALPQTGLFGG